MAVPPGVHWNYGHSLRAGRKKTIKNKKTSPNLEEQCSQMLLSSAFQWGMASTENDVPQCKISLEERKFLMGCSVIQQGVSLVFSLVLLLALSTNLLTTEGKFLLQVKEWKISAWEVVVSTTKGFSLKKVHRGSDRYSPTLSQIILSLILGQG